jgi:hypothetical protein
MGKQKHWRPEESSALQDLAGDMPMDVLWRIWNREATRHGWPHRSRTAIKDHLNRSGFSVVPTGLWLSLGALSELLGISPSTLNQWCHAGVLPSHQRSRFQKHYVRRADVRALAKREPWRFGGCKADDLFLVFEDRELADRIAADHPFKNGARRAVRCVTIGRQWESVKEACREMHCDEGTIRKAATQGYRSLGMQWEWVV